MNTVPYKPLKDLVNTYLPDEAIPPPGQFKGVKCSVCGAIFLPIDPSNHVCPDCQRKDKYL